MYRGDRTKDSVRSYEGAGVAHVRISGYDYKRVTLVSSSTQKGSWQQLVCVVLVVLRANEILSRGGVW